MLKPYFMVFMLSCLAGCNLSPSKSADVEITQQNSSPTQMSKIFITDSADLAKHVGQIVTLIGKQSGTYIPRVLGVRVEGDFSLSEQIMVVTGILSTYQTTEADVKAYQATNLARLAVPHPEVGTYFSITDPKTGEIPEAYPWNAETNNHYESVLSSETFNVSTETTSTYNPTKLHTIHFHREQLGVGKQAPGLVFCVRSKPSDPDGGTEVLVITDENLSKMGWNSLITLPEKPNRKEILFRRNGPQRFAAFTRFDIDGDGIDEVLLTGNGGAGGYSELTVFKIQNHTVKTIYHNGSKRGLAIIDIDNDGKFEIAIGSVEWEVHHNIISAIEYDIYGFHGSKFQKIKTIQPEEMKKLIQARDQTIEIPFTTREMKTHSALSIYRKKK